MVSVQLNMTEAAIPTKESHPASLYKSTSSPVAAEEENILTMAMGISSEGPHALAGFDVIPAA